MKPDPPHLIAAISSHGFGHISQTGPVLDALHRIAPQVRITVVSTAPEAQLRLRIAAPFRLEPRALDVGFLMRNAFAIDREASAAAYRDFHRDYDARVDDEARWLVAQGADVVLANAGYLPLAAAARAGIPAVGMSSLNWAAIFAHVFHGEPWAAPIHAQMLAAYRSARSFIRLRPAMPMPELGNTIEVGPVSRLSALTRDTARAQLRAHLGSRPGERIVLVAFGGIDTRLPIEDWPRPAHIRFIDHASTGMPFTDALAGVDAIITKPGYGTFVEAACHRTPVLWVEREDWPEQTVLAQWLAAHARAVKLPMPQLLRGEVVEALGQLWQMPEPAPPIADGAEVAARIIGGELSGRGKPERT